MTGEHAPPASRTHDWSSAVDHEHLEAIRADAATYAAGGLAHLVLEVLAHADEEAQDQARMGTAVVTRHSDGSISVADDGRGTAIRRNTAGQVLRKPVMSTRDLRFFDAEDPPLLPDGRPRRGLSTVAALSRWLEHTNRRTEGSWTQRYLCGIPVTELVELPGSGQTGTTVRFLPDADLVPGSDLGDVLHRFGHVEVQVCP